MQIFNVIIILIIIQLAYNVLNKRYVSDILCCGIFAWVGKDVKHFNRYLFNTLGILNDSRGGDSCGLYYDGNILKGMDKQSKYSCFIPHHNLYKTLSLKQEPVIIGHDRKMSVGHINKGNIQPIALYNDKDKNNPNVPVFVQAHNGTISNYLTLAKNYDIEVSPGESDSSVLARIIGNYGFKVLSEYEGTVAIIFYDIVTPNVLYAFHGESKLSNYYNSTEIVERPLAYLNIPGQGTYVSSDIDHLKIISNDKHVPVEFKTNIVYKLEGDTIEEISTIDRSGINAYKKSTYMPSTAANNTNNRSPYFYPEPNYLDGLTMITNVVYDKGLYVIDGDTPCHGRFVVNNYGLMITDSEDVKEKRYELFFVHGMLTRNRECYHRLLDVFKEYGFKSINDFEGWQPWYDLKDVMRQCLVFPFWKYSKSYNSFPYITKTNCWSKSNIWTGTATATYFSGTFSPIFSSFKFRVSAGDIISTVVSNKQMTIEQFLHSDYLENYKEDVDFSYHKPKTGEMTNGIISINNVPAISETKNDSHQQESAYSVVCPKCKGETYISTENGHFSTCDLCDTDGYVTKKVADEYVSGNASIESIKMDMIRTLGDLLDALEATQEEMALIDPDLRFISSATEEDQDLFDALVYTEELTKKITKLQL